MAFKVELDAVKYVPHGPAGKEMLPGHCGTVWMIAAHPTMPRMVSCGDEDRNIRVWDTDQRRLLSVTRVPNPATAICLSHDGNTIAVGMTEGDFAVLDGASSPEARLSLVVYKSTAPQEATAGNLPSVGAAKMTKLQQKMEAQAEEDAKRSRTQKAFKVYEEVSEIRYSPDSSFLAVASRDNNIYIFYPRDHYRRVGVCRGHSSYVTHIDWSADGEFLQSSSGDYELLYWQGPHSSKYRDRHVQAGSPRKGYYGALLGEEKDRKWEQYRDMTDLCDHEWETWTCTLGFPVTGIWPKYSDGTDVNSVDRSKSKKLLATCEDTFKVVLFKYPCLRGPEPKLVAAAEPWRCARKEFSGHMSHVQCVKWNRDDSRLFSAGGKDCCIFQWKHVAASYGGSQEREEHTAEASRLIKEANDLLQRGKDALDWRIARNSEIAEKMTGAMQLEDSDSARKRGSERRRRSSIAYLKQMEEASGLDHSGWGDGTDAVGELPVMHPDVDTGAISSHGETSQPARATTQEMDQDVVKDTESPPAEVQEQSDQGQERANTPVVPQEQQDSQEANVATEEAEDKGDEQVKAVAAYEASEDGELSIEVGDVITVTEKNDENWWTGTKDDGTSGMFPSSYVESA